MTTKDDREPIDVLYSIEDKIANLNDDIDKPDQLRYSPQPGTISHDVFEAIVKEQPATVSDIDEHIGETDFTRNLTHLYRGYLINREGNESTPYVYELSELGEIALKNTEFSPDAEGDGVSKQRPWEDTNLSRGKYIALRLVYEYDGHPKEHDIEEDYLEHGYTSESDNTAVSAQLSHLCRDSYIEKTPSPVHYFVTEKGKDVLNG